MAAKASDKFIPWYIVAFFAVQTVLFIWFAVIAHRTYTGVVMDDAYDKGIKYNRVIASAETQAQLGWHMDITAVRHGQETQVDVNVTDAAGRAIPGAHVKLWLMRPVQEKMDRRTDMQAGTSGYTALFPGLAPGLWELRAEAEKDGHRFQASKRVEL